MVTVQVARDNKGYWYLEYGVVGFQREVYGVVRWEIYVTYYKLLGNLDAFYYHFKQRIDGDTLRYYFVPDIGHY